LTSANTLTRARLACGKRIEYRNGAGGLFPEHALPCDNANRCDCSGFSLWALGVSRWARPSHPWIADFPPIGGAFAWIDTTRLYLAAKAGLPMCEVEAPAPGDLIVYGDWRGFDGKMREGHVGIIGQLGEFGGPLSVIHCSSGNWKKAGDAILETPLASFWKERGAIYARPLAYEVLASVGAVGEA
jgi:hypothetical protein